MLRPVGAHLLDVERMAVPCLGVAEYIGRSYAIDDGEGAATLAVLVDPCLGSPVLEAWQHLPQWRLPIVHPDLTSDLHPFLLDASALPGNRQQLFAQDIAETARAEAGCFQDGVGFRRSICALLLADRAIPMTELAARMAAPAVVTDAGGSRRLFRYWDPRIAWHFLLPSAPIRWVDVVATEGLTWWALDLQGSPYCLDVGGPFPASSRGFSTLTVEQEHWLQQISCFNAAWQFAARLGWHSTEALLALEPVLHACCRAGQDLRLEPDDLASFAARRLVLRVPIERSALLRDRLAEASKIGLGFSELQAQLDDEEWQRIAEDAMAARTTNGDFAHE